MAPIVEALERALAADASDASGPPGAPRAPARPARAWLLAGAALVAVLSAAAGARSLLAHRAAADRATAGARATAEARPPACRVEPTRTLSLTATDRAAVLPNGELVAARDVLRGLALTRVTPTGEAPFSTSKFLATGLAATGADNLDVRARGALAQGHSWLILEFVRSVERQGVVLFGGTPEGLFFMQSIPLLHLSGLAVTPLGKDLVVGVTTAEAEHQQSGAHVVVPSRGGTPLSVEAGMAYTPAVAASDTRVAFAYVFQRDQVAGRVMELHLALLDERAQRLGDVLTIAPTPSPPPPPAVAFAGDAPAVLWIDDRGGKTRLTMSTLAQGAASVSAPRVAIDEPVTREPPLTARLPSGEWVVAWLASKGGPPTLRVSPIGRDGALTGPTDIATRPAFEALRATSGVRGVELSWQERQPDGTTLAKFAHVTCAAH